MPTSESQLELKLIEKLSELKYECRPDIRDRAALEQNFREKFEALNHVHLTDAEFARLLDEIVTPDVFTASKTLRAINSFTRDDGTPLNYTLVNLKGWYKYTFEVVSQLRINTRSMPSRTSYGASRRTTATASSGTPPAAARPLPPSRPPRSPPCATRC